MTCNVWSKRAGGREGGREAPSSSSAPFLPVGVDPLPNGEAGRQAEEEGEVPATAVDIRNANKRPRGKGGREEGQFHPRSKKRSPTRLQP